MLGIWFCIANKFLREKEFQEKISIFMLYNVTKEEPHITLFISIYSIKQRSSYKIEGFLQFRKFCHFIRI